MEEKDLENFVDEDEKIDSEESVSEETEAADFDEKELEDIEEGIVPELIEKDLSNLVKTSFLEYAMSVIVAGASGRQGRTQTGSQKNHLRHERTGKRPG